MGPIEDGAGRQEERGLHQGVVDDMHQPAGQGRLVGKTDAQRDVADLGDRRIGEQSLQVALEHRDQRGDDDRGERQHDDHLVDRQRPDVDHAAGDGKVEPHQEVDRDLGRRGRQEGGHPGRRIGVGVGQPDMEREERELQADAHGDEGEAGHDRPRELAPGGSQARRHVDHVERAGHEVEQADADHVEGRADRAHDEILERRQQRASVGAEGDQHVARERRDLEEDEGIEHVAGHGDAEQPGEAQQVHAVEPRLAVCGRSRRQRTAARTA